MNTKFSFVLLAAIIALLITACGPTNTDASVPKDPAQPSNAEVSAPVLVTGESAIVERIETEPRLWSGEVFLSDNNQPDHTQNVQTPANQNLERGCFSEDSQPRPQGGCVE
jgi:hypothetical protein